MRAAFQFDISTLLRVMSSSDVSFPSPVGGVPFERDFGPSIFFACVYALLVFVAIYRFARSASRTVVMIGTFAFVVERCVRLLPGCTFFANILTVTFITRVVIWVLRAKQAKTPSEDLDKSLTIYWQITFIGGYISMYSALVNLLRCLYVGTTKGIVPGQQMLLNSSGNSPGSSRPTLPPEEDDQPRTRFWYRQTFVGLGIMGLIPLIIGVVGGYNYVKAETNAQTASLVQTLR